MNNTNSLIGVKVKIGTSMTVNTQDAQTPVQTPQDDKEINFAKVRNALQQEREARLQAEQRLAELEKAQTKSKFQDDDDDDDEPYVDRRKLKREMNSTADRIRQETQSEIQKAVQVALAEKERNDWMKNNPDFYDIMQHADKLAQLDPELAETILQMPDNFARQKLVYKNIKAVGLHKPAQAAPSIQDTIESNRRSPYYQPSGISPSPYGSAVGGKVVSESEGKAAYNKMRELQNRMRLG